MPELTGQSLQFCGPTALLKVSAGHAAHVSANKKWPIAQPHAVDVLAAVPVPVLEFALHGVHGREPGLSLYVSTAQARHRAFGAFSVPVYPARQWQSERSCEPAVAVVEPVGQRSHATDWVNCLNRPTAHCVHRPFRAVQPAWQWQPLMDAVWL